MIIQLNKDEIERAVIQFAEKELNLAIEGMEEDVNFYNLDNYELVDCPDIVEIELFKEG